MSVLRNLRALQPLLRATGAGHPPCGLAAGYGAPAVQPSEWFALLHQRQFVTGGKRVVNENPWDHTARQVGQVDADWKRLQDTGAVVNPCNSKLHPAAKQGIIPEGQPISVQEAYSPSGICFGCGITNGDGLHLKSFRGESGLVAEYIVQDKYQAFPGIVNGGIVGTLLDCHGNWTAAIALMDRGGLPRPPLTLTSSYSVQLLQPTPPNELLKLRSRVLRIMERSDIGNTKAKLEVEVVLSYMQGGAGGEEVTTAVANFHFEKVGALRAL